LRLANPISQEMTDMRPSLLPGLAQAARANVNRGFPDLALFEVGQVFTGGEPGEQMDCASGLRIGTSRLRGAGRFWQEAPQPVSLFDAKEDALSVLSSLGLDADKIQITRNAPAWYHPGKSGAIQLGPKTILAHFGELHPLTLKKLDLSGPVAAFEVFLNAIPQARKKGTAKPPLFASDFQPVKRDFAFLVDRDVEAAKLVKAVESATKGLMSRVVVFDVFEGERMPEGKKSVGIELTLTPKEGTLTDAEIDKIASEVVAAARKACHAELRM
jgi:phenylalanyl-tRNA synthetase beta chain